MNPGVADRFLDVFSRYIDSGFGLLGGEVAFLASTLVVIDVTLAALFPSWRGYSDADARLFAGNAPDSPVVRITLRADNSRLDAAARLARIYKPYVTDAAGAPTKLVFAFFKRNRIDDALAL